jgi:hypothetical protein
MKSKSTGIIYSESKEEEIVVINPACVSSSFSSSIKSEALLINLALNFAASNVVDCRDPTVKFFYFDRITRSKILKSANSLFKFIVINKKFEDYFGSRVEFYKAVEFIFIHLNMSKMITLNAFLVILLN